MKEKPRFKLRDRHKLAYDWIPPGCQSVLDGGCAFGWGTATFTDKVRHVFGCDPNPDLIALARQSYPEIPFELCPLEKTPYAAESFEAITLTDVLEHVADEKATLDEIFRILKPGGSFIITVPHKGLFAFMDSTNYVWHLREKFPALHRRLYRLKHGVDPAPKVGYESLHRHYNLAELTAFLEKSAFKNHFRIERVFYGSLFIGVFAGNVFEVLSVLFGGRLAGRLMLPLSKLSDWDYFINYGKLSYSLGILVKKS